MSPSQKLEIFRTAGPTFVPSKPVRGFASKLSYSVSEKETISFGFDTTCSFCGSMLEIFFGSVTIVILVKKYFGNFGKFDYNLSLSDKYLVEAKTLFDYKQYLLAYKALEKSNHYFLNTAPYLQKATEEGRDVSQKKAIFRLASEKHREVLQDLIKTVPQIFVWKPEKISSTTLDIKNLIDISIRIRASYL